jgi:hypothetical protein
MTEQELTTRYIALDSVAKARFISTTAHSLTIALRSDYVGADLAHRVHRLQGANELQHHLSSELLHHLEDDPKRYPDAVLIRMLVEKANYYKLGREMQQALTHAIARAERTSHSA